MPSLNTTTIQKTAISLDNYARSPLEEGDILRAVEVARNHSLELHGQAERSPNGRMAVIFTDGGSWVAEGWTDADDALAELAAEACNALLFLSECVCMTPDDLGERPYQEAHPLFLELDRLELLAKKAQGAGSFHYEARGWPPGNTELEAEVLASIARWVVRLVEPATHGVFQATPSGAPQ